MYKLMIALLLVGCGAAPQPTPLDPSDTIRVGTDQDGVELWIPGVDAEEGRRRALSCRSEAPPGLPSAAAFLCPVDLRFARIEVAEGPAGVSLMIRVAPGDAAALRDWYRENLR